MGFYSKCFTSRGKRKKEWKKKRERERELEKSLVRAKGRFGRLHCVRNMKIELGRMGRVISLSREPRISRTKDQVSFTNFSIPRWTTTSFRLHQQTYFARYLEAGHVAAIFISKRYIARDVHSVCPNNVARKSRRCLFHVMGIISLSPFSYHPVIARRRFVRRRGRNLVEELGPWS